MPISTNPFCEPAADGGPLIELKFGLVFYLQHPPSPAKARLVYDYYLRHCEERIRVYRSTTLAAPLKEWNRGARQIFETSELPELRQREDWGYVFSDNQSVDSWVFMFHGYRPHTEAGKASFYRFEFDWQVDADFISNFAQGLIGLVPCLSGSGGYYLQGRPAYHESYDRMYALARRYWGLEAHNLDVSVNHLLDGFKCVNWLTVIGDPLRQTFPSAIQAARQAAFRYHDSTYATLFQAQPAPGFGDRHRCETLDGYVALARALLPLQLTHHAPFGGHFWDDSNTVDWLHRFTSRDP